MRSARVSPFLATALVAQIASAQAPTDSAVNPWCHYHRGTLRQVVDSGARVILADLAPGDVTTLDRVVLWRSPYQQVRTYLVYAGHPVPLAPNTALLLDSATKDTLWRRLYHVTHEFIEGEFGFVLVVSDSIGAALRRLVAPGDTLWAFASVHGLVPGPEPYWVMTLDEFGSRSEFAAWRELLGNCSPAH